MSQSSFCKKATPSPPKNRGPAWRTPVIGKYLALAAALAITASPAAACRLALVLGMDVSNSVDAAEDALQRGGLAQALVAPAVAQAFFASDQPVALVIFEWSGRHQQRLIQDWILIDSPEILDAVSANVASTPRFYDEFPTAIGYALGYSATLLDNAPVCDAQTIDLSGDGVNNEGFEPQEARAVFDLGRVTINGLVIDVPEDAPLREGKISLTAYYEQFVIQGPGAFVQVADGFEDFATTMERKLIRELSALVVGDAGGVDQGSGG